MDRNVRTEVRIIACVALFETKPVFILTKLRAYVGGVQTDIVEFGIRAEGLEQALRKQNIPFAQYPMRKKIAQMMKTLLEWKGLPSQVPVLSVYFKILGQEMDFREIDREVIQSAVRALNEPADRHTMVKSVVSKLLNGLVGQWVQPLLAAEVRHIVPTTVGFPLEFSLYSAAVANVAINSDVKVTPPPSSDFSVAQLLESNMQLHADVSPSVSIHTMATMGINTHLIQSGIEFHAKVRTNLAAKFTAHLNIKEKNFKIETSPCQQENDLLVISTQVFAVTRNVEELDAAKKTPILPRGSVPNIEKKHFETTGRTSAEAASMMDVSSEMMSKKYAYSAEVTDHHSASSSPQSYHYCVKSSNFGFQVCFERKSQSAAFLKHSYFYRAVGEHEAKIVIKPAHTDAAIEKLQLEITTGPKAASKIIALVKVEETEGEHLEDSVVQMRLKKILGIDDEIMVRNSSLRQKQTKKPKYKPQYKHGDGPVAEVVEARKARYSSSSSSSRSSSSSSPSSSSSSSRQKSRNRRPYDPKQERLSGSQQRNRDPQDQENKKHRHQSSSSSSSSRSSSSSSSSSSSNHSPQRNNRHRDDRIISSSNRRSGKISNRDPENEHQRNKHEYQPEQKHGKQWSISSADSSSSSSSSSDQSVRNRRERHFYELRFNPANRERSTKKRASGVYASSQESSSSSSSESAFRHRAKFMGDNKPPMLVVTAQAVRSDNKKQGYQMIMYADSHTSKPQIQVYVVDITRTSRWRVCADAVVSSPHEAQASIKWGQNCQQYKIAVRAQTGHFGNQPAVRLSVDWPKIPSKLKSAGRLVSQFVPGAAYLLGFSEHLKKNPSHQAKIILSLSSPRIIDAVFKLPSLTLYYRALRIPIAIPAWQRTPDAVLQAPTWNVFSEAPTVLLESFQGECTVSQNQITTFNGVEFSYIMPKNCYHIIAQDCSSELKFLVMMRNSEKFPNHKDVNVKLGSYDIDMYYAAGSLKLKVNGDEIAKENLPYTSHSGSAIKIRRVENGLSLSASDDGIETLTYDGTILKVFVMK
ncbi:hypothetical protein FKM82_001823 [Ascaphus truei]